MDTFSSLPSNDLKSLIGLKFYFLLIWVLWAYQDYVIYVEIIVKQMWVKINALDEKHLASRF